MPANVFYPFSNIIPQEWWWTISPVCIKSTGRMEQGPTLCVQRLLNYGIGVSRATSPFQLHTFWDTRTPAQMHWAGHSHMITSGSRICNTLTHIQQMRTPHHRSLCHSTQHPLPTVLFQSRTGLQIATPDCRSWLQTPGLQIATGLRHTTPLHLLSPVPSTLQNTGGLISGHINNPNMTTTAPVYLPSMHDSMLTDHSHPTPWLLSQDIGHILHPNPQMLRLKAWCLHGSGILK